MPEERSHENIPAPEMDYQAYYRHLQLRLSRTFTNKKVVCRLKANSNVIRSHSARNGYTLQQCKHDRVVFVSIIFVTFGACNLNLIFSSGYITIAIQIIRSFK